jgi:protein-disulfide isomerase
MSEQPLQQSPHQAQVSITKKDLMIPLSIVIAGLLVGAGLYFGGGQSTPAAVTTLTTTEEPPAPGVTVEQIITDTGVDLAAVQSCVNSGSVSAKIDQDYQNGLDTGGQGTPWSILIGPGGKKYPINGALPPANVNQLIELARSEADLGPGNTEAEIPLEAVNPIAETDHVKGNPNGDIVIVEYSDYGCGFCARFHSTMNTIIQQNDDVAWVYRHLPFRARDMAEVAECVAQEGGDEAFWQFTDAYFATQF